VWSGQPQHWILSSPLFFIELAMYGPAALLHLPNVVSMALFSLIGWLGYYIGVRVLAKASGIRGLMGVGSALLVVVVLAVEASLEYSPDRNSLEPAALLSTTTYYSGSILATLFLLTLFMRVLRHRGRVVRPASIAMLCLSVLATSSNPLFVGWTVVPMFLVAGLLGALDLKRRATIGVCIVLLVGSLLGLLIRIPFSAILVQNNFAKVRPDLGNQSLQYYAGLVNVRLAAAGGPLEATLVVVVFLSAVATLVIAMRQRAAAATGLAAFAVAAPVIVTVASVVFGTFAARYLQPLEIFPPLALVPAIGLLDARLSRELVRRISTGRSIKFAAGLSVTVVAILIVGTGTSAVLKVADHHSPSLDCAVRWVNERNAAGAGQFWSKSDPN
jgi:hypothetical protein